jgi:hypothetical protein
MKSNTYAKSDANSKQAQPRHIRQDESDGFSLRLKEVIGDESVLSFANRCGFGESTLRNYLGGADPSRQRVIAIARTANVNFAWLATGEGLKKGSAAPAPAAPTPPLNTELLQAAVEGVQEGLRRINRTVPPDRHAQLIAAAYELLLDSQGHVSKDNVIKFIRAAA